MGCQFSEPFRQRFFIEEGRPLVDGAIAHDHGRGALIPLDQDVIEVTRLLGGELPEPEIVQDDQIGRGPAAGLTLEGVVGAGLEQGTSLTCGLGGKLRAPPSA